MLAGGWRPPRAYGLYGLCVRSPWPLPGSEEAAQRFAEVELLDAPAGLFLKARPDAAGQPDGNEWFQHVRLPEGSDYVRWSGLFEFLISADGRRISCHSLKGACREAFHAYLLGQVLSFALIRLRVEPLHSTAVVVDGEAVGFVGDCGYGKSSLGAAFLRAGHALLTDDLLVVRKKGRRFLAYPGPPRIKLFPDVAKALLEGVAPGIPMNPRTAKLVIPLPRSLSSNTPRPLKGMYVLRPPGPGIDGRRVTIRSLSQRRACLELIASTFNPMVVARDRLARQFSLAARLASGIPIKSLSYPRDLARIPEVLEAVRSDLHL